MTIQVPKSGQATQIGNIVRNRTGNLNFVQPVLSGTCCQYLARTKQLDQKTAAGDQGGHQ